MKLAAFPPGDMPALIATASGASFYLKTGSQPDNLTGASIEKQSAVIIGAGISGLYAATLLEKAGVDYVILEARDRTGGCCLAWNWRAPPLAFM